MAEKKSAECCGKIVAHTKNGAPYAHTCDSPTAVTPSPESVPPVFPASYESECDTCGDQTAHFVATRPYGSDSERKRAVVEYNQRVLKARRTDADSALAREPILALSGTTILFGESSECCIGPHRTAVVYVADSTTHRVLNRNEEPCTTWLCVRHWSEYSREDDEDFGLPVAEVRFSPSLKEV
jgi:hypothetical protein